MKRHGRECSRDPCGDHPLVQLEECDVDRQNSVGPWLYFALQHVAVQVDDARTQHAPASRDVGVWTDGLSDVGDVPGFNPQRSERRHAIGKDETEVAQPHVLSTLLLPSTFSRARDIRATHRSTLCIHSRDTSVITPQQTARRLCGDMQDPLDALPESRLLDSAPLSGRFRSEGVTTFRAACDWVRRMPYGRNARQGPDSVFEEKRGTCQSKHGLIALLAREVGVPVSQYAGAYRLDESIIEGLDALLAGHH